MVRSVPHSISDARCEGGQYLGVLEVGHAVFPKFMEHGDLFELLILQLVQSFQVRHLALHSGQGNAKGHAGDDDREQPHQAGDSDPRPTGGRRLDLPHKTDDEPRQRAGDSSQPEVHEPEMVQGERQANRPSHKLANDHNHNDPPGALEIRGVDLSVFHVLRLYPGVG